LATIVVAIAKEKKARVPSGALAHPKGDEGVTSAASPS